MRTMLGIMTAGALLAGLCGRLRGAEGGAATGAATGAINHDHD